MCRYGKTSSVVSAYLAYLENDPEALSSAPEAPAQSQMPDIMIEEVRLLDEEKKSVVNIRQFETVVVQIKTRRVGEPIMGHLAVGIGFSDDTQLFETTTKMSGLDPILFSGEQTIELVIPTIPILGGNYLIRVRVGDEHAMREIDRMTHGPFMIESDHPEIGMLWMRHSWNLA
jgi:hypothetical protein